MVKTSRNAYLNCGKIRCRLAFDEICQQLAFECCVVLGKICQQQRLRGFQQRTLRNFEKRRRFASPTNSRRFRPPFVTFEVALDSSWRALSFLTALGGCRRLEKKHEVAAFIRAFRGCSRWFERIDSVRCEGERRYRTLISLLGLLATMHRVVNYHSSWARQQQVELLDASGNPGFTAGRGFNPAGGNPGFTAGRGFNPAGGALEGG
ncbi:hypothetical protein F511_31688 [Dorcoceras hygrometricum]|uniref:Uncharacterized protein n=1 Tax=Dorcoceras hygrometricum TaxID=472368 RepID=A0A2Z7BEI5_9LAMI|nr:hypothetical protein F511_31688 [Dorcoceras hygrometricum]